MAKKILILKTWVGATLSLSVIRPSLAAGHLDTDGGRNPRRRSRVRQEILMVYVVRPNGLDGAFVVGFRYSVLRWKLAAL